MCMLYTFASHKPIILRWIKQTDAVMPTCNGVIGIFYGTLWTYCSAWERRSCPHGAPQACWSVCRSSSWSRLKTTSWSTALVGSIKFSGTRYVELWRHAVRRGHGAGATQRRCLLAIVLSRIKLYNSSLRYMFRTLDWEFSEFLYPMV